MSESDTIEIVPFQLEHIAQACNLVACNYREEQQFVPELPIFSDFFVPDIFFRNGLGIAALDRGEFLGFLCCMGPFDNQFGNVKGIFSPAHGHGAVLSNRKKIYSVLYSQAARIWVEKGILSHAIALYAHDTEGLTSFFQIGFGMRCIDAMRTSDPISAICLEECEYYEIAKEEFVDILPLNNAQLSHMHQSPIFMPVKQRTQADILRDAKDGSFRYFCACRDGEIIGYMKVGGFGENFISKHKSVVNICGAYLLPMYRGQGVASQLLSFLLYRLQQEGYAHVGVDFESINPPAREFWLRFFTPYIYSLVRRIDERCIKT